MEEIRGVTWDLDGAQLQDWQAAQRLYKAGFKDAQFLTRMLAVIYGESGWYLQAWHHNVERDADGNILRDAQGNFHILSTDLGFIQKNIPHKTPIWVSDADSQGFVDNLWDLYPELANGESSAEIAFSLYLNRGFQPWYAYSNGSYKNHLPRACVAVGNFLGMSLVDNRHLVKLA